MKDNFEKMIRENREAFDHREPATNVWERIASELPSGGSAVHWMWKAAAVVFFLSTLAFGYQQWDRSTEPGLAMIKEADADFNQVEDFYFSQISEKRNLIDQLEPDNIAEIDALAELQKLDAMYLVLRQQYAQKPTPEVIDAMTLNLLVRIDLLNRAIAELDQPGDIEI
ncbi:MAG: hypothetical protein P8X57_05600 [Cyclobacteriaceae bacterium]